MNPRTIGFLVFDQSAAGDVIGRAEAFARAKISTENGVAMQPQVSLAEAPQCDTPIKTLEKWLGGRPAAQDASPLCRTARCTATQPTAAPKSGRPKGWPGT